MSHATPSDSGPDPRARAADNPAILADLARACEAAAPGEERKLLATAAELIAAADAPHAGAETDERLAACHRFIAAEAHESAALALVPAGAVFSAARLADGSVIAQVVLEPGRPGAHSRSARRLAMALTAALLRAVAGPASAEDAAR